MQRATAVGFTLVLLSAFFFAVVGPIAKVLYEIGWTPGSVVLIRLAGSALLLLPFALVSLRGKWGTVRRHWKTITLYGLVSMAGVQGFYFLAVEHLSVAVAILLEMMGAPIIIVFWLWARTGRRPHPITALGVVVSLVGVISVLNLRGASLSWVGVAAALAAAACFAGYFLLSADGAIRLSPVALVGLGLGVGTVAVAVAAATQLMPARFVAANVTFAGAEVSWALPAALLVIGTVVAYVLGIVGIRLVGPTVGSFTNLSEVLFAVLAAWIILGEALAPVQLVGGAIVIAGIMLVKWGEVRASTVARTDASAAAPAPGSPSASGPASPSASGPPPADSAD